MAGPVGVAGVVAALSAASDLTRGHPAGEAMRASLVATELARRAGLDPLRQGEVYYSTLLRFAGCTATSHEAAAALGGDDVAVRARGDLIDATRPLEALRFLAGLGSGVEKVRVLSRAPRVPKLVQESARADCEVGAELIQRLSLPETVRDAVLCAFERYDGKGSPTGLAGSEVPEAARFAAVGFTAVMFDAVGGAGLAIDVLARWSGRALDPAIAAIFLDAPADLLVASNPDDLWAAVVEAEPSPRRYFADDAQLDEALAFFGDAADLKAPCFQGHARGVGTLSRSAAGSMGVDPAVMYRAGLLHDLGRVAVPTGVWERPGRIRPDEWEQVRLHPYHSARILSRSPQLEPLATIVSRHHERADGTGYPAGVHDGELDAAARLLAAADAWHALRSPRPHRPALQLDDAAQVISGLPLDRTAVRAVLQAADAPRPSFPSPPVELTARELEILQLLANGHTKRQIAGTLYISHSTVHTHTVHIYGKCGVSTRAGLAMFAMRHGLISTEQSIPGRVPPP
ncbi:HD domain-containing phosphohydrolase [Kribbella sp. CA-245084]|uniref:HD domain-containing phosphohydrolase n=1 Tax=Kribbella sp. CA-245084 TaxID=3239940 RepID=UPI003D8E215B